MFSESSPAIGLHMNVVGCIAFELNENLLWCLEVFPGAFGSDINSAVGVTGPAVLSWVEEVVRVHIGNMLVSVVAAAVKPVLGLQGWGYLTWSQVVPQSEAYEEGEGDTLKIMKNREELQRAYRWDRSRWPWWYGVLPRSAGRALRSYEWSLADYSGSCNRLAIIRVKT